MLSQVNKFLDKLKDEKEELTKPINDSLKAIRLRYKPLEEPLEEAKEYLRGEQKRYQTEQVKIQMAEEARIAEKLSSGKIKKLETAVRKIGEIDKPEDLVIAESGTVNFRKEDVLRIVDKSKIPLEYLIPDEKAILAAFKAGKKVDGCFLDFQMVPVNRR